MINAKDELLRITENHKIKCAAISFDPDKWWVDGYEQEYKKLKVGYSDQDFDLFLNEIDKEYDNGYGFQELFGTIWLDDGTWFDRVAYDGAEHWVLRICPDIPDYLFSFKNTAGFRV